MNAETEKQIAEIHAVVVNNKPAYDELYSAARHLVDVRYTTIEAIRKAIDKLEAIVGRTKPQATADCRPGSR